jgi:hypothetical protein
MNKCRPHDRVKLKDMKVDWQACLDNKVGFKVYLVVTFLRVCEFCPILSSIFFSSFMACDGKNASLCTYQFPFVAGVCCSQG